MTRYRFLLVFAVLACCLQSDFALAQDGSSQNVLTNAGVAKMVKAGLPENIIVRAIAMSRTSFDTSPAGLIELRKRGASEAVLNTVLDSWNNGGMPLPVATPGEEARSGGGQMPSFRAKVGINKKVHESIAVGHNHVEVHGSGIPAISVDWQTNPPER
jgi:hypothetical protein